jgi:hypothetical protein
MFQLTKVYPDIISDLPTDIKGHILGFLNYKIIETKITRLNKDWNSLVKNSTIGNSRRHLVLSKSTCSCSRCINSLPDKYIKYLFSKYKKITHITFDKFIFFDNNIIKLLSDNCSGLISLKMDNKIDLFGNHNDITCEFVILIMKCKNLQEVDFGNHNNISDECIIALAENCRNLQKLNVKGNCPRITDKSLQSIADNCKHLTHLTLVNLKNITDEGINSINKSSIKLISCKIFGCINLSVDSICPML